MSGLFFALPFILIKYPVVLGFQWVYTRYSEVQERIHKM